MNAPAGLPEKETMFHDHNNARKKGIWFLRKNVLPARSGVPLPFRDDQGRTRSAGPEGGVGAVKKNREVNFRKKSLAEPKNVHGRASRTGKPAFGGSVSKEKRS